MATTITAPHTVRFGPVGTCIYCGCTTENLTDEHIIPKGLGGTLLLGEASCGRCAQLTSKFEMSVLRGFLDYGRQALGIKGRKSHKRARAELVPQTFLLSDNTSLVTASPLGESIRAMHLPVFALPALLDPSKPISSREGIDVVAVQTTTFGSAIYQTIRSKGAVGLRIHDRLDVPAFGRMLAKIAHGYHVAVHGVFPLEESPLAAIILGTRWDAHNWIGNTEQDPLPSDRPALHLLQDLPIKGDDGECGTVVRIKLFASQPSPTYALVTRMQPGPPDLGL